MASVSVRGALVLLLALLAGASPALGAESCPGREGREGPLHAQQLRKALLCQHNPTAGPTLDPAKRAVVHVSLLRSRMDVDEATNSITLFGYIVMRWKDERLSWDRASHNNVTRVYVDVEEIWTPSIVLVENPTSVFKSGQALIVNGTVLYNILVPLRLPCHNDASRWPYDKIVCNMTIANLSSATAKLNSTVFLLSLVRTRSQGWSMTGLSLKPFQSTAFPDGLLVRVRVERNAGVAKDTAAVPCALLLVLALSSLWLPASAPHRPLLLCAVILLQVLLGVVVPLRVLVVSARPPGVLLLLRDGLFVSGAALLQWLLARWLLLRPPAPGAWPTPGTLRVLAPALCLPLDQDDAEDGAGHDRKHAARVSAIADRTTFVVLTVLCGALSARLLP
ncbi:Neuronal acetylcholine receptor subunit alpha-4 [Frankliniella fusca]|uniref:Neuronal acetylcholine receptor subunit alpha-4 n=1 Tax=Frankliniella fusca TaxID=407009 RepID=A0AAE1LBB2_9NEOP|nr:Neuronal acetylcholine receptor subunit alpha-4 [Frankliniella fusca]